MKMTFEVPDKVGAEFENAFPASKGSQLIADFMAEQAQSRHARDLAACQAAAEVD